MRSIPLPQTFRPIITASVKKATCHSSALIGAASGASSERSPAAPPERPIMNITTPESSTGNTARRRGRASTATSSRPANNVMPNTSDNPPAFAASSDGLRYAALNVAGHRKPLPTGPRRTTCSSVPAPSTIIPTASRLAISGSGTPTRWNISSG